MLKTLRKLIAAVLIVALLSGVFPQAPPTSAQTQISVYTDQQIYVAGDSVYVYGTIPAPQGGSFQVKITVTNPSGDLWSSISLSPDPAGDFGATVGTVSPLDSTGTYLVTVTYIGLTAFTSFQVRTPAQVTLAADQLVYLVGETISVNGTVSPLIEGYRVTLRLGTEPTCSVECEIAVSQAAPSADGSFLLKNFHKIRPTDNGHWFINATYGPFASTVVEVYVGLKITLSIGSPEYLPGQMVNVSGVVSPVVSGPVDLVVRNPSGGVWLDDEVDPDSEGVFSIDSAAFPGDQVGNYTVQARYWGVNDTAIFTLGRLGSSTIRIVTAGIFDINDRPVPWLYSGSTVRVRAVVVNDDVVSHPLLFIIQIKDSAGNLVFIGCQSSSVEAGGFVGQTIGHSFKDQGAYAVEIFVWDSWTGANALSEVKTLTFGII